MSSSVADPHHLHADPSLKSQTFYVRTRVRQNMGSGSVDPKPFRVKQLQNITQPLVFSRNKETHIKLFQDEKEKKRTH